VNGVISRFSFFDGIVWMAVGFTSFFGLPMAHFAIHGLMHEAALKADGRAAYGFASSSANRSGWS
jgi:hypothetical protein